MKYLDEVKSIIKVNETLFGAIKYDKTVHIVPWNDIMFMSLYNTDGSLKETPLYKTVEAKDMRIGILEEVFKKGYICFALNGDVAYDNMPIVLMKN